MPSCCAVQCNHDGKMFGCTLKAFPTNPTRAKVWENNIRRDNWKRAKWHRLCSCHFDLTQWEQWRADGVKKLRPDAVPLLFSTHRVAGQHMRKRHVNEASIVQGGIGIVQPETEPADVPEIEGEISAAEALLDLANELSTGSSFPETTANDFATTSQALISHAQTKDEDPQQKIKLLLDELEASKKREAETKKQLEDMSLRLQKVEDEYRRIKSALSKFLNKDQLDLLGKGHITRWSKETIRTCLQIRFTVGITGYNFLIEQKWPLPSYSTLCRRIQKIDIECGISTDTIQLMMTKATCYNEPSRNCVLSLDEMELSSKLEYDLGSKKVVGQNTLGDKSAPAKKLLLLVARGLTVKWKQIIGWHLTDGHSAKGPELWQFILDGVTQLEGAKYYVQGIVSDMGSSNMAIWSHLGIKVGRHYIDHPVRREDKLLWFADVPHVFKNIRMGFLNHKIILPLDIVQKEQLPTAEVSNKWVADLIAIESNPDVVFRAAPHLTKRQVVSPDHYEKMRVCHAAQLLSEKTAVGLEVAIKKNLLSEEALTTAWFIRQVAQWYETMTSRHVTSSITNGNLGRKEANLMGFADLVNRSCTSDNRWKPWQKGVIVSSWNTTLLAKSLLEKKSVRYFLTSRLTQDALENIFSVVRSRGCISPSPLQALRAVRLITVAQFTREIKGGNYATSEDSAYLDFLKSPHKPGKNPVTTPMDSEPTSDEDQPQISLLPLEADAVDHFTGHALFKCIKYACESCQGFIVSTDRSGSLKTMLSDKGGLSYPSGILLIAGRRAEIICKNTMKRLMGSTDLINIISDKVKADIVGELIPECSCQFLQQFCIKFVRSRLHFQLKSSKQSGCQQQKKTKQNTVFASKSADGVKKRRLF